jgi:hypothetical protein
MLREVMTRCQHFIQTIFELLATCWVQPIGEKTATSTGQKQNTAASQFHAV